MVHNETTNIWSHLLGALLFLLLAIYVLVSFGPMYKQDTHDAIQAQFDAFSAISGVDPSHALDEECPSTEQMLDKLADEWRRHVEEQHDK